MKKIGIGTDHHGFTHKEYIKNELSAYQWDDVGTYNETRTDYPTYALKVINLLILGTIDCGVLLCGTGAGMTIGANRHKSIYAAVAWNCDIAQRIKAEDNINVLVIPADYLSPQEAVNMIEKWINTPFKKGCYLKRLKFIDQ